MERTAAPIPFDALLVSGDAETSSASDQCPAPTTSLTGNCDPFVKQGSKTGSAGAITAATEIIVT